MVNKLSGFKLLKELGLPTVPWFFMSENTQLNEDLLWTVRTAVQSGADIDLPRAVGVTAEEAGKKYREFSKLPGAKVICYPYFVALLSGTVDISAERTVIEACDGDLWNLTTRDQPDYRYIVNNSRDIPGVPEPFVAVYRFGRHAAAKMRGFLEEGHHLYLEWSLTQPSRPGGRTFGEPRLVFYECRVLGNGFLQRKGG